MLKTLRIRLPLNCPPSEPPALIIQVRICGFDLSTEMLTTSQSEECRLFTELSLVAAINNKLTSPFGIKGER